MVQLQDVNGNPVSTAGISISVAIVSGSGVLNGVPNQGTDANGRATFAGLSITGLAGPYTLQFTGASLTGVTSAPINLVAGAATKLHITTEPPATAQSDIAMAPATVVQLQDVSGNAVSTAGVDIAASLVSGGGTLTGTLSVPTAADGTSTFSNLILTGTAGPRTVRFTRSGLTPDTSTAMVLTAGTATALEYVVQPSTVTAGQAITPAVTVRIRDGAGNTVTSATNAVTMAIGANPGSQHAERNAFRQCGRRSGDLRRAHPRQCCHRIQPGCVDGRTDQRYQRGIHRELGRRHDDRGQLRHGADRHRRPPVAAPPSVLVTDANGNPVAGELVTFAVTGGGGSILPITAVATNAAGMATLTSWTLGSVAGANAVTASAAGLTGSPVTFAATGVAGIATQLAIQTQPSGAAQSGVAFAVQPAVRLADAFGNTVPTTGTVVTAALATGTGHSVAH